MTGCSALSYAGAVSLGVGSALALAAGLADADGLGGAVGSVRSMSLRIAAKSWEAAGSATCRRFGSLTAGTVGTATKATLPTSMFFSRFPTVSSVGMEARPSSMVRFLVTTSAISSILPGLDSVPSSFIFRVREDRKPCCALILPRSPPSANACRVRRNASACSPWTLEVPLGSRSLESGS